MNWLQKEKWGVFFKTVIWMVLISFTFETLGLQRTAYAQNYLQSLPVPGTMIPLSPVYAPVLIKGIKTYPDNPFRFDFFIDPGQETLSSESLGQESNQLIKYFLASLTVPEDQMWVNLSPYEKDRIMPPGFGVTEMGRDLLAQDYLLKQISASLLDPKTSRGEEFWKKIYANANLAYENVNTFNKVWIVPDLAEVYTKDGNAFVVDSRLKVMLDEDYAGVGLKPAATTQTMRQIIVPALEKEVNEGKNFAILRQIYHAMILATWFKRHLRQSLFSKVYVGKNKVSGIDVDDKEIKEKIYQQYLAAFKKGVFNFIREDFDEAAQQYVPRKYFSGGIAFTHFGALDNPAVDSPYRETDNLERLRTFSLRPVGFMGSSFYRVSSVIVNGQGVDWYDSMNLTSPALAASAVTQAVEKPAVLSLGKLFGKISLRKAAGIAFATVALFSSLGFSSSSEAAQFSYDQNRGMIVHIKKNDTLGAIVQTLKKQSAKGNSALLSGDLWGKGGAVEKVAQAMQLTNKNTIVAGHTYVIPAGFLSATDYSGPQVQPEMVLKSSDPALKPAVSIENNLGTLKASMTPALALVTEGARLPASLSLENSSFQSPGQFMGPIAEGYLSPHPDIPLTLTSLLLASLAWSQRAALQKRVKIHSSLPGNTKVVQAQGSGGPQSIAETQLTMNLAQQISSLSLDYLQAEDEIKTEATNFVQVIVGDFRQRLLAESSWSSEEIDRMVSEFSLALGQAIQSAGEEILDRRSLEAMILRQASDLEVSWTLSGQKDLNIDGEVDGFLENELSAAVKARLADFRAKIQTAQSQAYRAIYLQAIDAAIVLHARVMPGAEPLEDVLDNSLEEISRDLSGVLGVKVVLQKPNSVLSAEKQAVNKFAVLSLIRQQSLQLQSVDARFNNQAKAFAGEIGKDLAAFFAPLKLSTQTSQPDPSAAVKKYFVPAISRYFLTGLYQRYAADKIENLLNDFAQSLQERFEGEDFESAHVQREIQNFMSGALARAISENFDQAVLSFEEDILSPAWRKIYAGALETSVQIERAIANGSGVLVVATVQKAVAELEGVLKEDHGLAALSFLTATMSTALAEENLEILDAGSQPRFVESNQQQNRAAPVSFAALDALILTATTAGMLATGQTDAGALAVALASPFLFRGGLTASYWLHEFSHLLAGGRAAWTKANLKGNISLREWFSMLVPFTGKVAVDAKVKVPATSKISAWFNRLIGFGTSLGIVMALGAALVGLWQAGMHSEVFSLVPVLWGSLVVALGSLKTDVVAPLKNRPVTANLTAASISLSANAILRRKVLCPTRRGKTLRRQVL